MSKRGAWRKLETSVIDLQSESMSASKEGLEGLTGSSAQTHAGEFPQLARTLGDAISLLAGRQTTSDAPKQNGTRENRHQTCRLRIRKAEERSRIDANKLDQKARYACQNQVGAKNFSLGPCAGQRPLP